mgnify:CR=1 FL=1
MSEVQQDPQAGSLSFLGELDEGRDAQFNAMGRSLVNAIFVLIRSAGMHDLNNDALIRPTQTLIDAVAAFTVVVAAFAVVAVFAACAPSPSSFARSRAIDLGSPMQVLTSLSRSIRWRTAKSSGMPGLMWCRSRRTSWIWAIA